MNLHRIEWVAEWNNELRENKNGEKKHWKNENPNRLFCSYRSSVILGCISCISYDCVCVVHDA